MQATAKSGAWQTAVVTKVVQDTYRAKTFTLALPRWRDFRAGQHFDVRLTAPDGYQAQRSYSISSPPERTGEIDITVELIPDGEVSPFFHEVVQPGDRLEVRGPIGGPFTWGPEMGGPLLLVAGGSGIAPVMSILRHVAAGKMRVPATLLYSSRSIGDVIYRKELDALAAASHTIDVRHTLTRAQPDGWRGYDRRVDRAMLEEVVKDLGEGGWAYVCGPTPFVESVANLLVDVGRRPESIRTERFGPTG